MPPAARISDAHACPAAEPGPHPHVGGSVTAGESTVVIVGNPAARAGDSTRCSGPSDSIARGEPSVLIGGKAAARQGDPSVHGGSVTSGAPSVLIGHTSQGAALKNAARDGAPFCAICAALR